MKNIKFFKFENKKNKVGRPKLADNNLKKKSIILIIVMIIILFSFVLTGLFSLNLLPKTNNLNGAIYSIDEDGNVVSTDVFFDEPLIKHSNKENKIKVYNASEEEIEIIGYRYGCNNYQEYFYNKEFIESCGEWEYYPLENPIIVKPKEEVYINWEDFSGSNIVYTKDGKKYYVTISNFDIGDDFTLNMNSEIYESIETLSNDEDYTWYFTLSENDYATVKLFGGENRNLKPNSNGDKVLIGRNYLVSMDMSEDLSTINNGPLFELNIERNSYSKSVHTKFYHPQSIKALSYNNDISNYLNFEPNNIVYEHESMGYTENDYDFINLYGTPKAIFNRVKIPLPYYAEIDEGDGIYKSNKNGLTNGNYLVTLNPTDIEPYIILTTYDKSKLEKKIKDYINFLDTKTSKDMSSRDFFDSIATLYSAVFLYNDRYSYLDVYYDEEIMDFDCEIKYVNQEEIDNLCEKIDDIMLNYKRESADYGKINTLLAKIKKLDKNSYTDKSWKNLEKQLELIENNMDLTNFYQNKVDSLFEGLEEAYEMLVIDKSKIKSEKK